MPYTRLDRSTQADIESLLYAEWKPVPIAGFLKNRPHFTSVYRMDRNLQTYGQRYCPYQSKPGPRSKITTAAKESLFYYPDNFPWTYQQEMVIFLDEEWSIETSQPTASRLLAEWLLSKKQGQRVNERQNEALKAAWQAEMKTDITAEMLVLVDESLFKEQSC